MNHIDGTMIVDNTSNVASVAEPEPEPLPESEPLPPGEPLATGEPPLLGEPQAEPIPDWSDASLAAKITRDIHVFGFAAIFLLIAIFCLVRLCKLCALRRQRTVSAVHFKTFLVSSTLSFCSLRSFVLFSVGYGSRDNLPFLLGNILWGISFACLAAAFSLMLVILMETTQFRSHLPCSTMQGHILAISTAVYVVLLVTTDVVLLLTTSVQVTLIVCRLFFIIWGGIMMMGYFTVSWRLTRNLFVSTAESRCTRETSPFKRLSALLSFCAFAGMILMAINVYAIFDVISDLEGAESPAAWPWLGLQTSLRTLEALMCALLMLISRGAERRQTPSDTKITQASEINAKSEYSP